VNRKGFTLIELVIVLAILVIAAGLLILRVGGWSSRQTLHASARAVGNTVRTWRERARLDEQAYVLRLEGRSYTVTSGEKETLRAGRLPEGQEFDRPTPELLTLTPRGVLPETRIAIRNGAGERVVIGIHPLVNEVDYADEK